MADILKESSLWINDICESVSGEAGGFPQGTWVTIVRLQGCNLACKWCDTAYSRKVESDKSRHMSILEILFELQNKGNHHIMITGGEPLYQTEVLELIGALTFEGFEIQVETNGSLLLPIAPGVHWVIDYKCPSSGVNAFMPPIEVFSFQLSMMTQIQQMAGVGSCSLKFVVADDEDLDYALQVIEYLIGAGITIPYLISPINGDGAVIPDIVKKIREKAGSYLLRFITFSVQLHKILNLP